MALPWEAHGSNRASHGSKDGRGFCLSSEFNLNKGSICEDGCTFRPHDLSNSSISNRQTARRNLDLDLGLGFPRISLCVGEGADGSMPLDSSCLLHEHANLLVDLRLGPPRFSQSEVIDSSQADQGCTFMSLEDQILEIDKRIIGGDAAGVSKSNSYNMDLQLCLTGTSCSDDTDSLVNGHVRDMHDDIQDAGRDRQYASVYDEGSTSARWLKSGGRLSYTFSVEEATKENSDILVVPTAQLPAFDEVYMEPIKVMPSTMRQERTSKACKFRGCTKGARGASGLCIAHGGGLRCQRPNCNKGAEGGTRYCKAHGGGRRCQYFFCLKSAEGRTDYCIAHGGGRRCNFEGCTRAARGRSGLCIRHGGGKRCQREGCTRSAEGFLGLCISHGGGRRCQFPGCGKGAQGSTIFCKAHGGGRRCEFVGCSKGAEGSTPYCKAHGGGKRCTFGGGTCTKSVHGGTAFCVAHGGGKRCAEPGCSKSARGKTSYCVKHGGGKRCKYLGCTKSAQGSTDFCKAHGGGKKCSWNQERAMPSGSFLHDAGSCDKFARGKTGLCAVHSMVVQSLTSHDGAHSSSKGAFSESDGAYLNSVLSERTRTPDLPGYGEYDVCFRSETFKGVPATGGNTSKPVYMVLDAHQELGSKAPSMDGKGMQLSLPNIISGDSPKVSMPFSEGRVHGGSLMAMLEKEVTSKQIFMLNTSL